MIELLLAILAVKYRHGFSGNDEKYDPVDDALRPYGGIDFEPPARERPDLRIVK